MRDCGGLTGLMPSLATSPATVTNSYMSEGTGGVVNELLVQMQSFDEPFGLAKFQARWTDALNLLLPAGRQLKRPVPQRANILLIAATNRADGLDPALLRPGRFDRCLTFDLPAKAARRDLIDHLLVRKTHETDLDAPERRDALAAVTQGYTPVMIEHLMDEALVSALRRGATTMSWADLEHARMIEEVGLGQPVAYTAHEKALIATHEAGHATVAWLVAPQRRLEILTIIKRRDALGLLAHGDREDVYTRSRGEMLAMMQIAFGGQVAEELFFGDVSTGPGRRLGARHQRRGRDGRLRGHDRVAGVLSGDLRGRVQRHQYRRPGTRRQCGARRGGTAAGRAEGRGGLAADPAPASGHRAARRAGRTGRADRGADH